MLHYTKSNNFSLILEHKIGMDLTVSSTLKSLHNTIHVFLDFLDYSVKKKLKTKRLWNAINKCDAKDIKSKTKIPTLSKSLKVKAGPTAVQKVLKHNLRKVVIYENKPRPASSCSQNTASGGCKILTNKYYNQRLLRHAVISCFTESFGFELLALPSVALFFD